MKAWIENISNEEYHKKEGLSASGLKMLLEPSCPKEYKHVYIDGNRLEQTDNMILGTQFHMYILEREKFDKSYYTVPGDIDIRRNNNIGKANYEAQMLIAGDRQLMTTERLKQLQDMRASLYDELSVSTLLFDGKAEQPIFWVDEETGLTCKTMPDYVNRLGLQAIDLKTCNDSSPQGFARAIDDRKYHIQGAMQIDGLKAISGEDYKLIYITIETKAPYCANVYALSDTDIQLGRMQYKAALQIYKRCKATGRWPSHNEAKGGSSGIQEISRSFYAQQRDDAFMGELL